MQYGKVEICGVNTSRLKLLSEDKKQELLKIIKNGSPAERKKARDEMINGNLRLVLSVIQRFVGRGENPDDLFQVGVIGLIKAIDNFDPGLDVRFSTYGVPIMYSSRNANDYPAGGTFMRILSTVQSIDLGIASIEARDDIPPKTKEQAIRLLKSLEQADWHKSWSKESVIDALNAYKERTGRAPTVTNLKEHGMPKGVTIQSLFHMSPSLLLKRLFPENRKLKYVNPELANPYGFEKPDDWLQCFREQFNKHKEEGMCCRQFNVLRDECTPTWETVARHCKIATWTELMKKAEVEYINPKIETVSSFEIVGFKSPLAEKLEALNEERKQIVAEYIHHVNERQKRESVYINMILSRQANVSTLQLEQLEDQGKG